MKTKTTATVNAELTAQLIQYDNNNYNKKKIQIENKLNDTSLLHCHTEYKLRASRPLHASSFSSTFFEIQFKCAKLSVCFYASFFFTIT